MRAVIWTNYGPPDVLQLRDVGKPVPGHNDVLVRVIAASVFAGDCELRKFDFPLSFWTPLRLMFGLRRPWIRIMGQELAGVIEAVGKGVDGLSVGDEVDVIIDVVGKSPYACSLKSLNENGRYILGNPGLYGMIRALLTSLTGSRKVIVAVAPYRKEALEILRQLIEQGKVKAVIDRSYPLELIAEAHACVDSGRKTGNVAVTVALPD